MAVLTIFIHSPGAGSLTWLPPSQGTLGLCFPPCQLQTDSSRQTRARSPRPAAPTCTQLRCPARSACPAGSLCSALPGLC